MKCQRVCAYLFLYLVCLATPRLARAETGDDDQLTADSPLSERVEAARAHFQKGVKLYDEGDFPGAIHEFQRAYTLQPTYRLLYNFGQVSYELQDYAAAERHFQAYLLDGGDDIPTSRRSEVAHDLETLSTHVARLQLQTDRDGAHLFVDERAVGTTPLDKAVHVNPGRRRIAAELAGYERVTENIDVGEGEDRVVRLEFGPHLATPAGEHVAASASGRPNWPLWTGIATGAFVVGAAGLGALAAHDASSYDDLIAQPTTRKDLDGLGSRTKREALFADLFLGAAIVTGAITVILLATASDDAAPAHPPAAARSKARHTLATR